MNKVVRKPWGEYTVIQEWKGHKLKGLLIKPGECTSLQVHKGRQETWHIVKGSGTAEVGDKLIVINEGDVITVPQGEKHRLTALSDLGLVVFEIQTGICEEDDIVRLEDKYGRSSN